MTRFYHEPDDDAVRRGLATTVPADVKQGLVRLHDITDTPEHAEKPVGGDGAHMEVHTAIQHITNHGADSNYDDVEHSILDVWRKEDA